MKREMPGAGLSESDRIEVNEDFILDQVRAAFANIDMTRVLDDDAAVAVSVSTVAGRVLYANQRYAEQVEAERSSLFGASLTDFHDDDVVRERQRLLENATAECRELRVFGMLLGHLQFTTYHPFDCRASDGAEAEPSTLCISRLISEHDDLSAVLSNSVRAEVDEVGRLSRLSERELQVLRLIGLGRTNDEIGRTLHRSLKTVEGHRHAITRKLGESNRVDLARLAILCGLTSLPEDAVNTLARHARRRHAANSNESSGAGQTDANDRHDSYMSSKDAAGTIEPKKP